MYSFHPMPVKLDCSFTVDATNANGISGLAGNGIASVYMHTSTTPSAGNPNPANGICKVEFSDNYYEMLSLTSSFMSPASGTPILVASAGVVANTTYQITVVGTTTTAGWVSLGLPIGVTPAVGVCFVASATTTATGTGAVQVPHANGTGIQSVEVLGNPNLTLNPIGLGRGNPYLMLRFMGPTGAGDTTPIAVAPRALSKINLGFLLSNSSVSVSGQT